MNDGDLMVRMVVSTRAFAEALFQASLAMVQAQRAMRRWARTYRLAFPVQRIHPNARRRPKRARRGR